MSSSCSGLFFDAIPEELVAPLTAALEHVNGQPQSQQLAAADSELASPRRGRDAADNGTVENDGAISDVSPIALHDCRHDGGRHVSDASGPRGGNHLTERAAEPELVQNVGATVSPGLLSHPNVGNDILTTFGLRK